MQTADRSELEHWICQESPDGTGMFIDTAAKEIVAIAFVDGPPEDGARLHSNELISRLADKLNDSELVPDQMRGNGRFCVNAALGTLYLERRLPVKSVSIESATRDLLAMREAASRWGRMRLMGNLMRLIALV